MQRSKYWRVFSRPIPHSQPAPNRAVKESYGYGATIPYHFRQIPLFPSSSSIVQPKLHINAPGDRYEQQADRIADQVMRREQGEARREMSQAAQAGGYEAPPGLSAQLQAARGGGVPLPKGTQQQMEGAFGHDFSQVRAHTDAPAAEMSRGIGARAFTHGSHIFFNRGEYRPGAAAGRELLAHELAHVVQQGGAGHTSAIQRDGGEKKEEPKEKTEVEALVTHDFAKGKTSAKVSTTRTGQEELAPGVTATATEKTTEESISTSAKLKVDDKSTGLSAAGGVETE